MASAASAKPAASAASDPEATLANLEEQIEIIGKRIEYNQLKIDEKEATMKGIVREYAGDETKKKERMPELKKHFEEKKQLLSKIETDRGQQSNLKDMHFNLLRQLWNETKSPKLEEKYNKARAERMQYIEAKLKLKERAAPGPAEGGKRKKSTTRKQKGRRATKKQNKNKKSRKQ